jgi:hypothetical protein
MKTFAATMLSVSLAGLCAVGAVSAQTPTPKQCQPAGRRNGWRARWSR